MEVQEGIYPQGARENVLYSFYAQIAMENYYEAKGGLLGVEEITTLTEERLEAQDRLEKCAIVSVVFSAMCVEAFLNDYAAACLGDDEFYSSFDMLSLEAKLKLICTFILKQSLDKSQLYYCRLKELIKHRNELIHSKSKNVSFEKYLSRDSEANAKEASIESPDEWLEGYIEYENAECKKYVQMARNGIEAIKEIAILIDTHDPSAWAIIRIFGGTIVDGKSFTLAHPRDKVLKEFRIGMK